MDKPAIYLSSFAAPGHHGPGRLWSMVARPLPGEQGEGRVWALLPYGSDLVEFKAGRLTLGNARERYRELLKSRTARATVGIGPGALAAGMPSDDVPFEFARVEVQPGDTVCCCCSVKEAARGRCHRAWAAPYLHRAGWLVILDGHQWEPHRPTPPKPTAPKTNQADLFT